MVTLVAVLGCKDKEQRRLQYSCASSDDWSGVCAKTDLLSIEEVQGTGKMMLGQVFSDQRLYISGWSTRVSPLLFNLR